MVGMAIATPVLFVFLFYFFFIDCELFNFGSPKIGIKILLQHSNVDVNVLT